MSFSCLFCLFSPFHKGVQKSKIVLKNGYSSNFESIFSCTSIGLNESRQSSILFTNICFKFVDNSWYIELSSWYSSKSSCFNL